MVGLEEILKFVSDKSDFNIFYTDGMTYVGERMEGEELHYTQTRLIDAYILYKALNYGDRNFGFDYEANDDEVFALGDYIAVKSGNGINIETIEDINNKMAIVGCKNFINRDAIRNIVSNAIDDDSSVGLRNALEKTIKYELSNRYYEIPKILYSNDVETLTQFIDTLNMITKEPKDKYIINDGKIYKYVGDI